MTIIKKLWWFFKLEKNRYLLGIVALSLVSLLNLLPPKLMGQVIDSIDFKRLTAASLLRDLTLLILTAFAMYGLRYLWRIYILGTAYRLGRILRYRLFEHFTLMSPTFFQKYRTGDLMAHATNDINALVMLAGGGVMSAIDASVTALVTLLTMFFGISWQLTLIAILPLPLMVLATSRLGRKNHEALKQSQAAFSDLNNFVQESVSGIKLVKSFGYQKAQTDEFWRINQASFEKNLETMKYNNLFAPVTLFFVGSSYVLSLLAGAFQISQGQLTLGQMITFITYLDMLVWPLQAIGFLFNVSQRGNVSYDRIQALLDEESAVQDSPTADSQIENGTINYSIDSFAYDQTEILTDIYFRLDKGQTLGLVGPTGSGKTTLLRLLMREYDLDKGQIKLNGRDIRDYRLKSLRRLMGYVPQEQFLFDSSIAENISFGNPNVSAEAVREAAKLAHLAEDIEAMPNGYETVVGEKRVSLSGGQKQRIAMSRALILEPDILILDDSLSAVDAKTEHAIIENLKTSRQGKTTLMATHRLSAVAHADLILVLDRGIIRERGSHQDLMALGGWYAQTYISQQMEAEGGEMTNSKTQWQTFKRLIAYLKPYRLLTFLALTLLLLTTVIQSLIPLVARHFIDRHMIKIDQRGLLILLAYLGLYLLQMTLSYLGNFLFARVSYSLVRDIRQATYAHMQKLGMAYFDQQSSGALVSRLTNDTESISEMFSGLLGNFISAVFVFSVTLYTMLLLDIRLTALVLIFLPFIFILVRLYGRFSLKVVGQTRAKLSDINSKLAESIEGIRIIQSFGQEERIKQEFEAINQEHLHYANRSMGLDALFLRPAMSLLKLLAYSVLMAYFGLTWQHSAVTAGLMYAFIQYINRLFDPLIQVTQHFSTLQTSMVSAGRVFDILDERVYEPRQEGQIEDIAVGDICFEHVSFSYDGKNQILDDVSFSVKKGQTIAFVGHTGSGKSSIINLLMRFYDFETGRILIDGKDIKTYSNKALRKHIGLVLQDPFLYHGTIKSNIRMYQNLTDEQIRQAAQFVDADQFIQQLPQAYDEPVTERGSSFSSGQRQLLAFARTVAAQPKILILDEATANIDSETETLIQHSLKKMRQGRTTIAIAHRLSTIQDADCIYVLDKGRIIESGNHEELIKARGNYCKMYELQRKGQKI